MRNNECRNKLIHIAGAAILMGGASLTSPAHALMTYVNPQGGGNGNERCLIGPTCSGGSYNNALSIIQVLENDIGSPIVRVDDGLDQTWANTINMGGQVMARARYASDTNKLGYDDGSGYVQLISSLGNKKVLVTDSDSYAGDTKTGDFIVDTNLDNNWVDIPVAAGTPFAFILRDRTDQTYWSSNNGGSGVASSGYNNSVNLNDHMVTFKISDDHYLIAWEDTAFASGDRDYNDFVAEVMFVMPVPVPAAIVLLGSALLGLGALRKTI
jgi:hypothetical protein